MALKFEYNKAELTAEVCGIDEGDTIAKIPATTEYYKKTYRVTKIAEDAFKECIALKNIIIPGSVKEIVNGQFKGCSNLESVTISDGVTIIGEEAFYVCTNLESIIIPNSVVEIGKNAFTSCSSLKSITLPDSVKEISIGSFSSCYNLEYVAIGNGVTRIRRAAFSSCKNLRNITIPDSVEEIDAYAFSWCPNLKEFKGKFATEDGRSLVVNNRIISYANASGSTYNIPENVTVIGYYAFAGRDGLKVITIPDSVEEIDAYAFSMCSNLKEFKGKFATEDGRSLVVNNRIISYANAASGSTYDIPDSVTEIGTNAFRNCKNLRSVTIPDSVIEIGEDAFRYCENLECVKIGKGVTEIGTNAFFDCKNLRSMTIPDNVIEIGKHAFVNCENLECVKIGKGVTEISFHAFLNCRNLKDVIISDGVLEIGTEAFYNCSNLKEVSIPSSVKEIGPHAFNRVKVVNIYNDEGNVIIHPYAFNERTKVNYFGKKQANSSPTVSVSEEKQIDLDKLIDAVVADGVITEKERAVILKKATAAGYDADEVEILLDGRLHEKQAAQKPVEKQVEKKKPAKAADDSNVEWSELLWEPVREELLKQVKVKLSIPKGKPYVILASENHKGLLQYIMQYSVRDGEAIVRLETYGGEDAKNQFDAKIAASPAGHPIKQAVISQGQKNKDKWAWTISTKIDKSDAGLVKWYAETLLAVYAFMEK